MLGVGSLKRELLIAGVLAVCVHILLLLITFKDNRESLASTKALSVTLKIEEQEKEIQEQPLQTPEETKPAIAEQLQESPPKVMEAEPKDDLLSEPETVLTTSLLSQEFKALIQQETHTYRQANPNSVEEFSETFEDSEKANQDYSLGSKAGLTKEGLALARSIGVFMSQDKNGRRTCGAYTHQLLIGGSFDGDSLGGVVTKDCTPEKKFKLNLSKPNNGWMNR